EVHIKGLSNVFSKNERRPLTAVLFRSAGPSRTSTEAAAPSILQRALADISIPKTWLFCQTHQLATPSKLLSGAAHDRTKPERSLPPPLGQPAVGHMDRGARARRASFFY